MVNRFKPSIAAGFCHQAKSGQPAPAGSQSPGDALTMIESIPIRSLPAPG
jgi:hypothetical protein